MWTQIKSKGTENNEGWEKNQYIDNMLSRNQER